MVSSQIASVSVVFHTSSDQVLTLLRSAAVIDAVVSPTAPAMDPTNATTTVARVLWSSYHETNQTKNTVAMATAQATTSTRFQWRRL